MIFILWPTCRPAVALKRAAQWLERALDKNGVTLMFGVNHIDHMTALNIGFPQCIIGGHVHILIHQECRPGATATATKMSAELSQMAWFNDRDIVVLASDDFEAPEKWDEHLRTQVNDGALIVNDGYKPFTNIVPMPVVSGAALKRLNGILYHPVYHHFFSDQELFDVVTELGIIRDLRGTDAPVFHHRHWSFGGRDRDHYDERNNTHWAEDKATYELRKTWPVERKLTLLP